MPSFRTAVTVVVAALAAGVQSDYYIEPSSVPMATRR